MDDQIPTGAYIISHRDTALVLWNSYPSDNTKAGGSAEVKLEQRNENAHQYRDGQIWWIEPLPSTEGEDGIYYSISNPSLSNANHLRAFNFLGGVCAFRKGGGPRYRWKIQRGTDTDGRSYYTISRGTNDRVLYVANEQNNSLRTKKLLPEDTEVRWDLLIPVVAFPPGYFQIQNEETGYFLTHTYLSTPPVLSPPTRLTYPSQFRESWSTQWTLTDARIYKDEVDGEDDLDITENNRWIITNRLTGARLANTPAIDNPYVTAWETEPTDYEDHIWRLELDSDSDGNWNIIHHETSCLLEQSTKPRDGGTEVVCHAKGLTTSRKWIFTSPNVRIRKRDEAPPKYDAFNVL